MLKLVLATKNNGKITEFERMLDEQANSVKVLGLNDFPDYYELSYTYNFLSNDLILSYGDFDPYINNNSSNGKNYSVGIDSFQEDFTLGFFYYYFDARSSSNNNDDGFVFSISKKTSF